MRHENIAWATQGVDASDDYVTTVMGRKDTSNCQCRGAIARDRTDTTRGSLDCHGILPLGCNCTTPQGTVASRLPTFRGQASLLELIHSPKHDLSFSEIKYIIRQVGEMKRTNNSGVEAFCCVCLKYDLVGTFCLFVCLFVCLVGWLVGWLGLREFNIYSTTMCTTCCVTMAPTGPLGQHTNTSCT